MNEIIDILEEVANTNSRLEKENILKQHHDNLLLQRVFLYAYSPYKIYGFGKKSLEGISEMGIDMIQPKFPDIFNLLDYLTTVNANSQIRGEVTSYLLTQTPAIRDLYIRMILKDLRVGATSTIANNVWEGLIPKFELMQGKKYENYADKIKGETIIITTKLDGHRFVAIKDRKGHISIMSRSGKPIEGCTEIEEELKRLPNNMVYDGEVLKANPEGLPSKDLFNATKKVISLKGVKTGLEFHVFDMLPLDEFEKGKSKKSCLERKRDLEKELSITDLKFLKKVPLLYVGEDLSKVDELLKEAIANEQEGLMLNLDAPYECKRSSQLLKIKEFFFADLRILNVIEGEGKNKGKLGAITVQFEHMGELHECNCGSGFTDEERVLYYKQPELLIGKIAVIKYFEFSQNQEDEGYSLRFATWENNIRHDKTEISMN